MRFLYSSSLTNFSCVAGGASAARFRSASGSRANIATPGVSGGQTLPAARLSPGSLPTLSTRGPAKTHVCWVVCRLLPGLLTTECVPLIVYEHSFLIGMGGRGGPPRASAPATAPAARVPPATAPGGRGKQPGGAAFPRFCLRAGARGIGRKTHDWETVWLRMAVFETESGAGDNRPAQNLESVLRSPREQATARLGGLVNSQGRGTPGELMIRRFAKRVINRIRASN